MEWEFILNKTVKWLIQPDGVHIVCDSGSFPEQYQFSSSDLKDATSLGKAFLPLLPMLIEQGLVVVENSSLRIPSDNLYALYEPDTTEADYDLARHMPSFSPFLLEIRNDGALGSSSLRYEYTFHSGSCQLFPVRRGCFIKRGETIYCLQKTLYQLLETIDRFNMLSNTEKTKERNLREFADIKSLCLQLDSWLHPTLQAETVIVPDKLKLGMEADDEYLSVFPEFEGVDSDALKREFRRFSNVQGVYDIATEHGGRIRVVLDEEMQQAVRQIRTHLTYIKDDRKDRFIFSPTELFEGVCSPDRIDHETLPGFGNRVRGIGNYVFTPRPFIKAPLGGVLPDYEPSDGQRSIDGGIRGYDQDGEPVVIDIRDFEKLNEIEQAIEKAEQREEASITVDGHILPLTETLKEWLSEYRSIMESGPTKRASDDPKNPPDVLRDKKYVLIFENDELLDYKEEAVDELESLRFHRPDSLVPLLDGKPFELMSYQKEGVAWLQSCFDKRRGVLLADDMGLGKTLQVLTFLAWCIENGNTKPVETHDGYRYDQPILIVAEKILLKIWEKELKKFFYGEGAVFTPYEVLHGDRLKYYRNPHFQGREFNIGEHALDLEKLSRNQVIITNYDTVKNYQHSFCRIKWSIVVIDEAQAIKEDKTAITFAMKALNVHFRIAMTGTPVENRLLNLWTIMDFAQPGLLGTSREFSKKYEADIASLTEAERQDRSRELRQALRHDRPARTFVLNRQKEDHLKELMPIQEHILESPLSDRQWALQQSILAAAFETEKKKKGQHLKAVQDIRKLYEHIALMEELSLDESYKVLLDASPKLQKTIAQLKEIKRTREKVLIFASFHKMQRLLKTVLEHEFGLSIAIINGNTHDKSSKHNDSFREQLINEFQQVEGFHILILSPHVAGVGLTITGANHVIHYGRWWNPAVEAQATARVHRIGQTKEVHVYYPISTHPEFTTFDQKLHKLLQYKESLRKDFLTPVERLTISDEEIWDAMKKEISPQTGDSVLSDNLTIDDIFKLNYSQFEALGACLLSRMGYDVWLTPCSGDYKFDIVAIKNDEVILAQAKHTLSNNELGSSLINEMMDGLDYYQNKFFSNSKWRIKLYCITNLKISNSVRTYANAKSIDFIDKNELQKLLRQYKITRTNIFAQENERLPSMQGWKPPIFINASV